MPTDIVAAGHVCVDIAPAFNVQQDFQQVFSPGRLSEVGAAHISTGGSVANTGLAAHALGAKTVLMGKVGTDAFGQMIHDMLVDSGAEAAMSVSDAVTTSYSVVLNLPGTDRVFLHHPGANDQFTADDIDEACLRDTRVFHLGYPSLMASLYAEQGQELERILRKAKAASAVTSLDMAMPDPSTASGQADWPGILERTMPFVDLFLPSYEELFLMLERDAYLKWRRSDAGQGDLSEEAELSYVRSFAQRLIGFGAAIVAIKCGRNGIYLRTAGAERLRRLTKVDLSDQWIDREIWAESFCPEQFVSSTGAGDCAIAGFLNAVTRGCDPDQALQLAAAAGCQNLRAVDAISGLGSYDDLRQHVAEATEFNRLSLEGSGLARHYPGLWMA